MSDSVIPSVLFVVEGGASVGMGHVRRSAELAGELAASFSLGSVFSINDDQASLESLATHGMQLFGNAPRRCPVDEMDYRSAPLRVVFDLPRIRDRSVRNAARALRDRWTLALDYFLLDDPSTRAIVNLINHNAERARPPEGVDYFEGPQYAIVRRSFDPFIANGRRRDKKESVLVALGGSDPSQHMLTVLDAILKVDSRIHFRLVVGPAFSHAERVIVRAAELGDRVEALRDPPELERVMSECDVALTNGGTTFMECLALGLATIVVPHSIEELRFGREIAGQGAALVVESPVTSDGVAAALSALADDNALRKGLSSTAQRLVDGKGRHRVARIIRDAGTAGA